MVRALSYICLALLAAQTAHAADAVRTVESTDVEATALTIYPDNLTLVRETRTVDLPAGVVDIQFFGVTDMIIPQSAVLEQFEGLRLEGNFDSDLITPAKLLKQAVGETFTIRRLNPVTGKSDFVVAELISAAPTTTRSRSINAVFSTAEGIEGYQCSGLKESILFSKLPDGLHTVPVLSTRVVSETAGPKDVVLTYLTRGVEWSADYRMDVDDDKTEGSLLGWLTLKNETSKSFKDTQLSFVAGALNQVKDLSRYNKNGNRDRVATCVLHRYVSEQSDQDVIIATGMRLSRSADSLAAAPQAVSESFGFTSAKIAQVREATQEDFGDYKLYRAPQAVSVNANQTKQIAFLFKNKVEFDRSYSWNFSLTHSSILKRYRRGALTGSETPADSRLSYEIDNEKDGSLAADLPKGILRVMSERQDGTDVFLGEGRIQNTPVGDTVDIAIADSFLVTSKIYNVQEDDDGNVSGKLDLKNATDEEVKTEFDFDLFEVMSVRRDPTREEIPGEGQRFTVIVPAEDTVTLSFEGKIR